MIRSRLVFFGVCIVACGISFTAVFAEPSQPALQAQLNASRQQLRGLQARIQEVQQQARSIQRDITIASIAVEEMQVQIQQTEAEIALSEQTLSELTTHIDQKQADIFRMRTELKAVITEYYQSKKQPLFQRIIANFSLSHLFLEFAYSEDIQKELDNRIGELHDAEALLLSEKDRESIAYAELLTQQEKLMGEQARAQDVRVQYEVLLAQAEQSEDAYQAQYSAEELRAQRLENELSQVARPKTQPDSYTYGDIKDGWVWPVSGRHPITCVFHCSDYYRDTVHNGMDIGVPQGTPVYAAHDGYIERVVFDSNSIALAYIRISHAPGDALVSYYLHLSDVVVAPDTEVRAGDLIGYSGGDPNTVGSGGREYSSGPHLHFEIREVVNGVLQPVDPRPFLP